MGSGYCVLSRSRRIRERGSQQNTLLIRHKQREVLIRNVANNILIVCQAQEHILEAAVTTGTDIDAPIQLAILQDQIAKINFQVTVFVQVRLTDSEKVQQQNAWSSYRTRNVELLKHRCQVFYLMLGQCTLSLQSKMEQDITWNAARMSNDPITMITLIEKTVLAKIFPRSLRHKEAQ